MFNKANEEPIHSVQSGRCFRTERSNDDAMKINRSFHKKFSDLLTIEYAAAVFLPTWMKLHLRKYHIHLPVFL